MHQKKIAIYTPTKRSDAQPLVEREKRFECLRVEIRGAKKVLTLGCEKTTNDATKFSYHFLLSDAQPDFPGTFHQDFSHIAQAR